MSRTVIHGTLSGLLLVALTATGCQMKQAVTKMGDGLETQIKTKGQELEDALARIHSALASSGQGTSEQLKKLQETLVTKYKRHHRPEKLVFFREAKPAPPRVPTARRPEERVPAEEVVPAEAIETNLVSERTLERRGLRVLWKLRLDGSGVRYSAVDGDLLYLVTRSNRIYCVRRDSGLTRWVNALVGRPDAPPGFSPDYVVLSALDTIHVIDKFAGKDKWRFETDIQPASPACCDDTHFLFGSWTGTLHGFQFGDRHPRWTYTAGTAVFVQPGFHKGMAYAASDDGTLSSYNAQLDLGDRSLELGGRPVGMTNTENMLFVGTENFEVIGVQRAGLLETWSFGSGGRVTDGPWLSKEGHVLYFAAHEDGLYALTAATGKRRWRVGGGLKPVAITEDKVFVLRDGGQLCLVDAGSGQILWTEPIAPFVGAVTNISNDIVHLYTRDGRIYAVAPRK
ncbi:MAG: PQQ-binding-like beta-propeller repeat protein [Planctomycetota bacterium]